MPHHIRGWVKKYLQYFGNEWHNLFVLEAFTEVVKMPSDNPRTCIDGLKHDHGILNYKRTWSCLTIKVFLKQKEISWTIYSLFCYQVRLHLSNQNVYDYFLKFMAQVEYGAVGWLFMGVVILRFVNWLFVFFLPVKESSSFYLSKLLGK